MPGGLAKGAYFNPPYPLTMARGEGCEVEDIDGRRYIDFVNHHTAQVLGHAHPAVLMAVSQQIERGIALGAPVGAERALAEQLCARVPSVESVRFCNSGTEASLHAIRLIRAFTGRTKIAKLEGGYHGSHDAVEVSVAPSLEAAGPADAPHAVPASAGMSPGATGEVLVLPYNDEDAVDVLLEQHAHKLAGVIVDPSAGILPVRPEFLRHIREVTHDHGMLMVLDEVVSFRAARGGLQERYAITPDLTTFGKLVGGGFPVGAFGGRAEIMNLLDSTRHTDGVSQSGTFSAHPVTMTAGFATLQELTPAVYARLEALGERLRRGLTDAVRRTGARAQVVVLGSLFSVHFRVDDLVDYRDMARRDTAMAQRMYLSLLEQGYFLNRWLTMNAISAAMDESHIDGLVVAFERAVDLDAADGQRRGTY